jgi:hypothetical protein
VAAAALRLYAEGGGGAPPPSARALPPAGHAELARPCSSTTTCALEAVSPRVPLGWGLKEVPKDTRVVDRSVVQLLALFFGQRVVALVGLGAFSSARQFCADALEHDRDVTPHLATR